MLEILFLFSQFQCGPNAELAKFQLNVGDQVLNVGDSATVSSYDFAQASYKQISGGDCALDNVSPLIFSDINQVPDYVGVYNQTDVVDLIEEHVTEDYLSLSLWEVGTTNVDSSVYDVQDLAVLVSTEPGTLVPPTQVVYPD